MDDLFPAREEQSSQFPVKDDRELQYGASGFSRHSWLHALAQYSRTCLSAENSASSFASMVGHACGSHM